MRNRGHIRNTASMVLVAMWMLVAGQARASALKVLQFTATPGNISGEAVYFNSSVLNNKRALKLIVTQNFTGTYNPVPVGVFYTGSIWAAFNEDQSAMPAGASFNVMLTNDSSNSSPLNSGSNFTLISPERNRPNGVLLMTHLWGPNPLVGGIYVNHSLGLTYNVLGLKRWGIVTEDQAPAPVATYNLADATRNENAFLLTTTASNIDGANGVSIDQAVSNRNPNAVIFVTPVVTGATYWNHPVGVSYDGSVWKIINEDQAVMPAGLSFNVEVFNGLLP